MNFDEYQEKAMETAVYPDRGENFIYPALGLCGEAGEVAEKIKKIIRDKHGIPTDEDITAISKELGDVMWYIAALCYELGLTMDGIALMNTMKLSMRKAKGVLQGSGDDR